MSEADQDADPSAAAGRVPPETRVAAEQDSVDRPVAVVESGVTPEQEPRLDLQSYIGVQLRAAFDDIASQPVPDRFLELMRKLG